MKRYDEILIKCIVEFERKHDEVPQQIRMSVTALEKVLRSVGLTESVVQRYIRECDKVLGVPFALVNYPNPNIVKMYYKDLSETFLLD